MPPRVQYPYTPGPKTHQSLHTFSPKGCIPRYNMYTPKLASRDLPVMYVYRIDHRYIVILDLDNNATVEVRLADFRPIHPTSILPLRFNQRSAPTFPPPLPLSLTLAHPFTAITNKHNDILTSHYGSMHTIMRLNNSMLNKPICQVEAP